MQELLKKDLIYKIVSVLLAFLLWFFVTNLQNPTTDKLFSVPITFINLQDGLVTGEKPENVEIRLKGPHSIINGLTANDIKATVDFGQAQIGESNFQVKVQPPSGVEILSYEPTSITLDIDAITEKQLSLEVKKVNSVAEGYSSYEPELNTSRVVVRGPRQLLEQLETAQVVADLNQASDNLVLNLPVNIINKAGDVVPTNNLEVTPLTVQVYVPVIENIPTKTVSIRPSIIGNPKDDWQVARIILEPETVKITGPYERIMEIDHVQTQPINIAGIQENLTVQVALTPPEGVGLLYEPVVKVLVQIEEAPVTKTIPDVPIRIDNKPEGMNAVSTLEKVKVTVRGPRQEFEALKEGDIKAFVDVKDLKPGTYQLDVKISLKDNLQVQEVDPGKVEVKITKE